MAGTCVQPVCPPFCTPRRDYAWEKFADSIGEVAGFCDSALNEQDRKSCAGAQVGQHRAAVRAHLFAAVRSPVPVSSSAASCACWETNRA